MKKAYKNTFFEVTKQRREMYSTDSTDAHSSTADVYLSTKLSII